MAKMARKSSGFLRSESYECQLPWPDDCFCQCGDNGIVLPAKMFEESLNDNSKALEVFAAAAGITKPANSYRTAFFEAFPKKPDQFIRGEGKTIEEAEFHCWQKYQKILYCSKHEYKPSFYKDGQGICRHCGHFAQDVLPLLRSCFVCGGKVYSDQDGTCYCEKHFAETDAGKEHFRSLGEMDGRR